VVIALLGGLLLALASSATISDHRANLTAGRGFSRIIGRLLGWLGEIGAVLLAVAVAVAAVLTIAVAGEEQRPTITIGKIDPSNPAVSGTVTAGNLASDRRLTVLVDGLVATPAGYEPHLIYQNYVSPDGDGGIKLTIDAPVPKGQFDGVGIRALMGRRGQPTPDKPCHPYPATVATEGAETNVALSGCVVVKLSGG